MLAMITEGRLSPERLVTRRIGLSEAGAALGALMDCAAALRGITIVEP